MQMRFRPVTWVLMLALVFSGACSDSGNPSQGASDKDLASSDQGQAGSHPETDQNGEELPPIDPQASAYLEVIFTIKNSAAVAANVPFEIRWEEDGKPSKTDSRSAPDGSRRIEFDHGSRLIGLIVHPSGLTAPTSYAESRLLMGGRTHKIEIELELGGIVSGKVLDFEGNPVAKAQVAAFFVDPIQLDHIRNPKVNIFTHTDENGAFRLGGFPKGQFVLEASFENMMAVWRPGGVMLKAQELRDLEIFLEPGHVVYGQTIDSNEQPIADVRITAGKPFRRQNRKPTQYEEVFLYGPRACLAQSDEAGLFTLSAVPESQAWNIVGEHPLYQTVRTSFDAGQQDVWLEMSAGAAIAGNITTPDGRPVVSAQVWLLSSDGEPSVFSDKDGNYLFGVGADRLDVCVLAYKQGLGMKFVGPMDIVAGMASLDFVLDGGQSIAGKVVDADGNGLSGVPVRIRGLLPKVGYLAAQMPERFLDRDAVLTSADGSFQFQEVYDSIFTVTARPAGKEAIVVADVKPATSDLLLTSQ